MKMTVCLTGAQALLSLGLGVAHAAGPVDRELRAALHDGPPGGLDHGAQHGFVAERSRDGDDRRTSIRAGQLSPVPGQACLPVAGPQRGGPANPVQEVRDVQAERWGMTGRKGATSYYNHQCCGAHAKLIGRDFAS